MILEYSNYDRAYIDSQFRDIIKTAITYEPDVISVLPTHLRTAKNILSGTNIKLSCPIDFPLGILETPNKKSAVKSAIKKGAKIDNLIQIAHNVEIGENTVIAAQTGIAGSTKIGKNVMIGGQVGIVGHIKIAEGVKIAAQSGIGNSITKENQIVQGSPAFSIGDFKRCYVLFRGLPKLKSQLDTITKEVNTIKNE